MARDLSSIVKMSRREGYALHPKAHRVMVKRAYAPGQHGNSTRRIKVGQYALQLREKQKVKRLYGLLEKQFSNLMKEANKRPGQSGVLLLQYLERRLDNVVYRAGFAVSRRAARQLVTHGHFQINGRRVDVPSLRVSIGDEVTLRKQSVQNLYFKHIDELSPAADDNTIGWLKVNRKKFTVSITGEPTRDEAESDINEQLIVEYYSR